LESLPSLDSPASSVLALEGIHAHSLDISHIRYRDHHIFSRDQILHGYIKLIIADACSSLISVFFGNDEDFFLDHTEKELAVCEDRLQFIDLLLEFCILVLDLLSFQTCQSTETHVDDRL